MQTSYDLQKLQKRNQRHLLNTKILGAISMLFVYAFVATIISIIVAFFSPIFAIFTWFGIIIIAFIVKWRRNTITYHEAIDNFLQFYHAQLLFPTVHYKQLFNIIDEICIGSNIQRPDVYLINFHQSNSESVYNGSYTNEAELKIYDEKPLANKLIQNNIMGLQLDGRTILVINQDLLNNLNRYELEAVMSIEIGYTKDLFNTFLLAHHIVYDTINKFVNIIIGLTFLYLYLLFGGKHHHVHLNGLELKIAMIAAIIFGIFYIIKKISYGIFRINNRRMIKNLNQSAIALTENPRVLISALQKIDQNNYQPTGESMYNNLWLNPLTDESGDPQKSNIFSNMYNYVNSMASILGNQLFNQRLRIPIQEQLKLIYDEYQITPPKNEPNDQKSNQPDSKSNDPQQQFEYAKNLDMTHIQIHRID